MRNISFEICKGYKLFIACCISMMLNISNIDSQSSMFGNNPQHTGFYNSSFRSDLKLTKKWTVKTKGRIFSSAAVFGDMVFIGSDDSCLYASTTEGTLLWKFAGNGMIRSTPAVKDTIVYFNNFGGTFYALEISTGKEIWSYKTDGESLHTEYGVCGYNPRDQLLADPWDCYQSSPVISDSLIYFGSGKNMYAMNLKTRALLWKYPAGNIIHSTPCIANGVIFFGCWDSKLYALDALTGVQKWVFQTGSDPSTHLMEGIASSPSVIDSFVYIGSRDGYVYAVNAKNGKEIWRNSFFGSWMPSSFAISNDTIYTGSSDASSYFAMNRIKGSDIFSTNTKCYDFSTPAITNETGFIGCMNGSLYAFNRKTGRILCRFDTDGRIKNILNVINDDGSTNPDVLGPVSTPEYSDALEFLRRLYTAGSILSSPVIDKNVVYFGSTDSCLYAVYDDGSCRSNISVKTGTFEMGILSQQNSFRADTSFYVANYSDCTDSVNIYLSSPATLKTAITFEPDNFIVDPNDSVLVKVKINCNGLKPTKLKAIIGIVSKSNMYKYFNSTYNFEVFTDIKGLNIGQKTWAYPNPFTESTKINFYIQNKEKFKVGIFNLSGQKIKDLTHLVKNYGEYSVTWDGRNDSGARVASGPYLVCFEQGSDNSEKLVIILK